MRAAENGDGTDESRAHVASCAACRSLLELARGVRPTGEQPVVPREPALPTICRDEYDDWSPLPNGVGGMGRTWRARDRRLGRMVVIKEPLSAVGDALRRRFEHEALLTARLQHPAIVSVYEAGRWSDGLPFYAMPWIDGSPLDREIARRTTFEERLQLLPNVAIIAEAVAYAHSCGIVHRDIKPQNVLIGRFGETRIIDWGLGKDLRDPDPAEPVDAAVGAGGLTVLGVGTPQYMPPEQALGRAPTEGFDVYALGATLYHVLAGQPPYGDGDATELRRRLLAGPPPSLAEVEPRVPPALVSLVESAMARDPAKRLGSAKQFADELGRFLAGGLMHVHRYSTRELLGLWARRNRGALRIAAVAAVVLIVVGVVSIARIVRERDHAARSEMIAMTELARARGTMAMHLARDPRRRLDALAVAVTAATSPVAILPPEAEQGLFDALTLGPLCRPFLGHRGVVLDMTFDREGRRLYSLGTDRMLRVWNVGSGALETVIRSSLRGPFSIRVFPDARHVVLSDYYGQPELWDLETKSKIVLDAGTEPTPIVELAADGRIVTASYDGHLRIWERSGVKRLDVDFGRQLSALAIAPDGGFVVGLVGGTLRRVDASGQRRAEWAGLGEEVAAVIAPRTGDVIAVGDRGSVFHWREGEASPRVHRSMFERALVAAVTSDLRWVSIMGGAGSRLVDLSSGRVHDVGRSGRSSFSPHGDRLVVWDPGSARARLWDLERQRIVMSFELGSSPLYDARFSPDGSRLALSFEDGAVAVCDPRGRLEGRLGLHRGDVVAVRTLGDQLVTASTGGDVGLWDVAARTPRARIELPSEILVLASAPGGDGFAVGTRDGTVRLFDTRGQLVRELRGHAGAITSLAYSARGSLLSTSLDGTAVVWSERSEEPRMTLRGEAGAVMAGALVGEEVAITAGADGRARIWNLATGAVTGELVPDAGPLDAVHVSPDGHEVAIGAVTGRTFIYDARSGRPLRELDGAIADPAISPFGRDGSLATASRDGRVWIHRPGISEPILLAHDEQVISITLEERRATTVSLDGSVRQWQFDSGSAGATVRVLRASTSEPVRTAALAAEGAWIAVGRAGGLLSLLPVSRASALEQACAILAEMSEDRAALEACARIHGSRGGESTRSPPNQMRAR